VLNIQGSSVFNTASWCFPFSPLMNQARYAPELLKKLLTRIDKNVKNCYDGTRFCDTDSFGNQNGKMNNAPSLAIARNQIFLRLLLYGSLDQLTERSKVFYTRQIFQPQHLKWLGISQSKKFISILASDNAPLRLIDWMPYKLDEAFYCSKEKFVKMQFKETVKSPFVFTALCQEKPVFVLANQKKLQEINTSGNFTGWNYNQKDKILTIKLADLSAINLDIQFEKILQPVADIFAKKSGMYEAAKDNLLANSSFEISKDVTNFNLSGNGVHDVFLNYWSSTQNEINKNLSSFNKNLIGVQNSVTRNGKLAAYLIPSLSKGWLTREVVTGIFQDVKAEPDTKYLATFYYCAADVNPEDVSLRFAVSTAERNLDYKKPTSTFVMQERITLYKEAFHCSKVFVESTTISNDSLAKAKNWQKVELPIQTSSGNVFIRVGVSLKANNSQAKGQVYIDDVSLKVVKQL
jgi:hypothetical protein